ncbi:MAG TPA: ATP-binding protein [Candidatus Polarisedimenticolia bacterium]|nr:ATP-binding protein [Candidatus Polarisedimenticolia bacterium]
MSHRSSPARSSSPRFSPPGDPFYRQLFASLRCGCISIDREGRITSINALARKILELKDPDLGMSCSEALKDHPKLASIFMESFRMKNQPNRAEMDLRLRDGRKRTIGFSMPLIRDDAGQVLGAALLFRDLTQIEHRQEQEQLKERLAALGQMAAGMAHEIRNPLGGIEVTASLLRRRLATRPEELSLVDRIVSEVKRLNRTVVDSLEYVRPLHLERRPASLAGVVQEAVRSASIFQEGKTITLSLDLDPTLPLVWMDPERMRDAIANLVRNSLEAIPLSGEVRVETRREILPSPLRSDSFLENDRSLRLSFDSYAVVRITDTGKGIPEEVHDRLFYPFFTTKQTGSGVGLPLARKIVDGHQGILDFESQVGRGSTFIVKLPLVTRHDGAPMSERTSETSEP